MPPLALPRWRGALFCAFLFACHASDEKLDFEPTPPRDLIKEGYPAASDGSVILMRSNGVELRADPKATSPLQTAHRCLRWLTECREPPARTLDACFAAVPTCRNEKPWLTHEVCCPSSCAEQYKQRRQKGETDVAAFRAVMDSCFPWLDRYFQGVDP